MPAMVTQEWRHSFAEAALPLGSVHLCDWRPEGAGTLVRGLVSDLK